MAKVPEDKRASGVRQLGDALHVVHISAFEDDMREGDEGGVFVDGGFRVRRVRGDIVIGGTDHGDRSHAGCQGEFV